MFDVNGDVNTLNLVCLLYTVTVESAQTPVPAHTINWSGAEQLHTVARIYEKIIYLYQNYTDF